MRKSHTTATRRSAKLRTGRFDQAMQSLEQRLLFATFTPGDFVVYRAGDGTTSFTGTSIPVFLDEYSPTGTLVQSIALPTTSAGSGTGQNQPLTGGTSGTEGLLTVAANGESLIVPGYDLASSSHTVGLVGPDGSFNTSNTYIDFAAAGTPRSAASPDGSTLYFDGSTGGVHTAVANGTQDTNPTTEVSSGSTTVNLRGLQVVNGTVYISTASGSAFRIGSLTGNNITSLPGLSGTVPNGPYGFFFASDLTPDDTLYVADNGTNTIDKFSLVSGTWMSDGTLAYTGVTDITGVQTSPTNVTLYADAAPFNATTASTISSLTDTLSLTGATPISGTLTTLVTVPAAGTNGKEIRGDAMVPQVASAPAITLQPVAQSAVTGTNATFTAWASGTPAPTVQWMVNKNDGNGYNPVTNALVNTSANFTTLVIPATTSETGYTYEAVFTNSAGSKTSNAVALTVGNAPVLGFSAPTYSFSEGSGTATITVDRIGDTSATDTVAISLMDGTAVLNTNYTNAITGTNYSGGILTFPAGDTSEQINIPLLPQHPQGGTKSFTVMLGATTGAGVTDGSPSTATVNITDNEEFFSLSSATYSVNETVGSDSNNNHTAIISVLRTGVTTDAASVNYATSDGSAVNGTNYSSTSGTLNFAAGQTVATFSIPITAASPQGGNKSFTITLSSPSTNSPNFGVLGTQTSATETIVDQAPLANNLSTTSPALSDVEAGGPFTSAFAPVVGSAVGPSGSFNFISYEVLEFSKATNPGIYPASGSQINSIQNLSLKLYNTDDSSTFNGHPGNFNVYFIPNSDTTTPTSGLTFQPVDPNGLNGQGGTGPTTLLGTFSFNDSLGYDTYTPASIPAGVASALVADLNSGANFRLAVTPQTTGMVADWAGTQSGEQPTLAMSATEVQTKDVDQFDFSSPTYTVNENAGTVTIDVKRTFTPFSTDTPDAASVQYTTSDGSALNGTNYTTTSGTATFTTTGPGESDYSFTIPITNVNPQGGNKFLNITLTNPSAGANSTTVLGQSTATVTIIDTHVGGTPTDIAGYSDSNAYVQPGGPVANTKFLDILGSSNGSTAAFGLLDFNVQDGLGFNFTPNGTVTAINSVTLGLVNSPFSSSANGLLDVYLVSDANTALNSASLKYDATDVPEGLDGTQTVAGQVGTKILLGQINYLTSDSTTAYTLYTLSNYNQAALNTMITDLNTNQPFRFALTDESATTSGTFVGVAVNANFPNDFSGPELLLNADIAQPLPSWLDPSSDATWDSTNHILTVNGPTTIVSDPGGDDPQINVTGSGDQLIVNDTGGGTINITSLTVSGGGTSTVDVANSANSPVVLNIGSLSLSGTAALDLGNNELVTTATPASIQSLLLSGALKTSASGGVLGYKDLGGGQTEVRFTVRGDANLDGIVNVLDFNALSMNYNKTGQLWANGDFTNDGKVNAADFDQLATGYGSNIGGGFSAPALGTLVSAPSAAKVWTFSISAVTAPAPVSSPSLASSASIGDVFNKNGTLIAAVLGGNTDVLN